MSFVRTLATLAAGYAAAKGFEKYKEMGGMAGVQKSMRDNPQMASAADQVGQMLEKMGVPGGAGGPEHDGPVAGRRGQDRATRRRRALAGF